MQKRKSLRNNPRHRTILYYEKGFERIDKALDMAEIIKSQRVTKQLVKILLDKDQRRLLQLKGTELISSDDEKPIRWQNKKCLKKNKLVDMYVDNLRSKRLTKADVKLFQVTGFGNILKIMSNISNE